MPYCSFEVHGTGYNGKPRCYSRHHNARTALNGALRAERTAPLETGSVRVWCAGDNRHWTVAGFRAAYERGDYA